MKVSVKWLQDYVDLRHDPDGLARELTRVGLAVEGIRRPTGEVQGVVAGQVLSIEKHPQADNLWVCTVDVGRGEPLTVVTGAQNVRAGHKVPVALPGARIAGGREIGVAQFRGVTSQGMLCSPEELGIDEGGDGILILPPDAAVGADCVPLLGLDDTVLELELTANYAIHAQCMVGVAQEYAAATGQAVRWPEPRVREEGPGHVTDRIRVRIEAPDLCRRYCGRLVEGVRVGPSPAWLQRRLRAAGMRPINNVVDVTNYVMLELGQPLHAFDYHRIAGQEVVVRRARPGETLVGLDGVERTLDPDVLVIADAARAQVIAGVFGGQETEVRPETTAVFLEAAWFDNINNRRTARRYNLLSEASARFTKGVDPSGLIRALDRAAELLVELAGGRVVPGVIDLYPAPYAPRVIPARLGRLRTLTGLDVTAEEAVGHLRRLGFAAFYGVPEAGAVWEAARRVSPAPVDPEALAGWEEDAREQVEGALARARQWAEAGEEVLVAVVPTRRLDVRIEEDLAEEVAREHGFDRIAPALPVGPAVQGGRPRDQEVRRRIRHALAGMGLAEVMTYSLVHPRIYDRLRIPEGDPRRRYFTIQNPLYDERSTLRTTLAGSLLDVVQYNVNRQVRDLALFEVGKVYHVQDGDALAEEEWRLAIAATGAVAPKGWDAPARAADFFWLKGVVEGLLDRLGIAGAAWDAGGEPYLHHGRRARLLLAGQEVGSLGEVHPEVQAAWDLPQRVYLAELRLAPLVELARDLREYRPVPRFPAVVRDLAFVVGQEVPARVVGEAIRAAAGEYLEEIRLFDLYQGPPVPEGKRSLAYSLTFRAPDRTLTEAEVNEAVERVRQALADLGAELRG